MTLFYKNIFNTLMDLHLMVTQKPKYVSLAKVQNIFRLELADFKTILVDMARVSPTPKLSD